MPALRIARRVERDLEEIWDFIAQDNPDTADHCVRQIYDRFHFLAQHPYLGRPRSELALGLRSVAVGNYVIFYQPLDKGQGVAIVRVIEGHCDIAQDQFEQSPPTMI